MADEGITIILETVDVPDHGRKVMLLVEIDGRKTVMMLCDHAATSLGNALVSAASHVRRTGHGCKAVHGDALFGEIIGGHPS